MAVSFEVMKKKMEQAAGEEEKQLAFEEFGRYILEQRMSKQAGAINSMLKMEFVEADYREKSLVVRFPVQSWELNSYQTLHGGVSAAAVDVMGGMVTQMVSMKTVTPTVNLNVNYLAGVREGENLMAKATVERAGRTLVYVRLEAWVEGSEVRAIGGMGTYMVKG